MSETAKNITTIFEEKDRRFKETWQPRLTLLISLAALIFSVLTIVTRDLAGITSLFVNLFGESRLVSRPDFFGQAEDR
jgi:hypothetical protein